SERIRGEHVRQDALHAHIRETCTRPGAIRPTRNDDPESVIGRSPEFLSWHMLLQQITPPGLVMLLDSFPELGARLPAAEGADADAEFGGDLIVFLSLLENQGQCPTFSSGPEIHGSPLQT